MAEGSADTALTRHARIDVPLICGAMYPCSNPELVAAVSEAGGIGIIQPISLTYVHGHDFREGLRLIRRLTSQPVGMNALIEQSSRSYHERMTRWIDIALEEGVRFFVTSLGNPALGRRPGRSSRRRGLPRRHRAEVGREGYWPAGCEGLIAVNRRAGGHAGGKSAEQLMDELASLGLPLVCAGGIGDAKPFSLRSGSGMPAPSSVPVSSPRPSAGPVRPTSRRSWPAGEDDIVHSERITGVPVAVIRTPYIDRIGLKAGPVARWMLRHRRTKHLMRTIYALRSIWQLKRASLDETGQKDYWQAGKSVGSIDRIEPAGQIVRRFAEAFRQSSVKSG